LVSGGGRNPGRQIGEGFVPSRPIWTGGGFGVESGTWISSGQDGATQAFSADTNPSGRHGCYISAGDDRWNKIADSLDLLFDKIDKINVTQRQMQANLDLNTKALIKS
jgi:hypothetical protein